MTETVEEPTRIPLSAVYGPRGESILRQLAGEWFLVPIRATPADFRAIFTVNELGALVWEELDGARGLDAILERILERFDVTAGEAEQDLIEFVAQLEGAGLAERRG
jgi:hypothetical protein